MKKLLLLSVWAALAFNSASAQTEGKFVKISYLAYPISTHDTPPAGTQGFKEHSSVVSLAQSYKHYYSLIVNTETNESIYKLDTLIVSNKPEGMEKHNYMINNNLYYVVKNSSGNYFKYEKIFNREFYAEGKSNDIEWEILSETKKISGMNCRKAVSKKKEFLVTIWYTEDVPVAAGPVNFFGLPGLVVWSEDFSWTTELQKIEFLPHFDFVSTENKLKAEFDSSKKGKTIDESLLLVKKAELVKSMIESMKKAQN